MTKHKLTSYLNWLLMLGISVLGLFWLKNLSDPKQIAVLGLSSLVCVGAIGTWRWAWIALAWVRSRIYLHLVFNRWRRSADRIPTVDLPPVAILAVTFKEQPWITEKVFRAIASEAKSLTQPITLAIVTTEAEVVTIRQLMQLEDPEGRFVNLIPVIDAGGGKRKALADGLYALARQIPPNTIVALMDGDTVLSPGTLRKCLPFFLMFPKMGALTTDEIPIVVGSYLFSEWMHVRFCQRHLYMCSHSLSRKLLCLTGRFSLFRGEAALDRSFIDLLENDNLNDWLWGQFKFLSGDDKSTWYWMLSRGYDLLYIPDAVVSTIETVSGSFTERVYQNMRRWFGNMLRNGNRALGLGPNKTGWFIWYCLLDQRISIWTALIAPTLMLIYALMLNWTAVGLISAWIIFTRPLLLMVYFWGRESQLKPIHLPILLLTQWCSSAVKVWTQMNLAQQKWKNRGNQSRSVAGATWKRRVKSSASRFLLVTQVLSFVILLLSLLQIVNPLRDLPELWWATTQLPAKHAIAAINYKVVSSDTKDDSTALNALIASLPAQGRVQINLPAGEIDLRHPLEINRSDTILKGEGVGRTVLQTHFNRQVGEAGILIRPTAAISHSPKIVNQVQLSSFTLRQMLPASVDEIDGITIQNAAHTQLRNLDLEQSGRRSLVRRQTQGVQLEYVTLKENSELAGKW